MFSAEFSTMHTSWYSSLIYPYVLCDIFLFLVQDEEEEEEEEEA